MIIAAVGHIPVEPEKFFEQHSNEESNIDSWNLRLPSPSEVSFCFVFEPTNVMLMCSPLHKMPARHKKIVNNKVGKILAAEIMGMVTLLWYSSGEVVKNGTTEILFGLWGCNRSNESR